MLEDGHLAATSVDSHGGVSVEHFRGWVGCSASASVLLSRVESHLVVNVRSLNVFVTSIKFNKG